MRRALARSPGQDLALGSQTLPVAAGVALITEFRAGFTPAREGRLRFAQNGWAQYSVGIALPCLIVMSWGEIGADAWEASILPASFGLAKVEIDHTAAIPVTATIVTATMILRIWYHLACDDTARGIGTISPAQA
jgi:predicted anti-sigma-YlaC factor YlaD